MNLNPILQRAIRGAVATGLGLGMATLTENANWAWLAPILLALGKGLRTKYPKTLGWLPL